MMDGIKHKTIGCFGKAFVSQFRLRYQALAGTQYRDMNRFQGVDDQYATKALCGAVKRGAKNNDKSI